MFLSYFYLYKNEIGERRTAPFFIISTSQKKKCLEIKYLATHFWCASVLFGLLKMFIPFKTRNKREEKERINEWSFFFLSFSFDNWKGDSEDFFLFFLKKTQMKIRDHHHLLLYSRTGPLGWSPVISCIYCAPRHIFSEAIAVQIQIPPRLYLHHPLGPVG
jgi:hypothetical protein